jgi:hypothetical protein
MDMHLARLRVLRRAAIFAGFAALLVLTVIGLSQCTMVQDNITGVGMTSVGPGQCISQCAHDFGDSNKVEFDRYSKARAACKKDDVCLALENARHDQAKERIKTWFANCRKECHHQGGGHTR